MNCELCGKECDGRFCSREHWLEYNAPIMIERAGLNIGKYGDMELNTFEAGVNLTSRINKYVDDLDKLKINEIKGLYIFGSTGNGKTHLMIAIAKEIIRRRGLPVVYMSVPEWINGFFGSFNIRNDLMDRFKNADVLLMDDFGASQHTDYTIPFIGELINHRWVHKRLTYFTSNLSAQHVKQIDQRIISRISGMCKFIQMTGDDRRAEK